jgi:hypothetical protein
MVSYKVISITLYRDVYIKRLLGKMNIVLGDKTEERFRKAVADNKGMKKGNISVALEEAIELWIEQQARMRVKGGK